MITTAFLIKVIIYGLVAAVIIPAIDFLMFVIRESRRPDSALVDDGSEEWTSPSAAPPQAAVRGAAVARLKKQQWEQALAEVDRTPGRKQAGASNGMAVAQRKPGDAAQGTRGDAAQRASEGVAQRASEGAVQRAPRSGVERAAKNVAQRAPASEVRRADSWPTERVYVASNGVTITPGPGAFHGGLMDTSRPRQPLVSTSGHPHAEYWTYGSPRFYEHR